MGAHFLLFVQRILVGQGDHFPLDFFGIVVEILGGLADQFADHLHVIFPHAAGGNGRRTNAVRLPKY